MPRAKKQTAGDRPSPQQRGQRGRGTATEEQQLGNTGRDRRHDPKLPHERDESTHYTEATSAAAAPGNEVMKRAHDDVAGGKQDTDRGPVLDQTYHELRKKK